ncbi:hypothetical protein SeLEV6574_g00502 [Synchytrium endobioticum]|uniref:Thioredoxin domain-containing protein n=1 Tax=Synchytrium endobioticum TaxID=286115 RepID=A0A507DJQ3_9FUNG|nr:hypothetical protein SeLEV6574_g00502 [Synchytrium endobioticum]
MEASRMLSTREVERLEDVDVADGASADTRLPDLKFGSRWAPSPHLSKVTWKYIFISEASKTSFQQPTSIIEKTVNTRADSNMENTQQDTKLKVGQDLLEIAKGIEFSTMKVGDENPQSISIEEVFKGRKVVLFGLPGAYTSVCSQKQVPQFSERYTQLRDAGADEVYCTSVNDGFVMAFWFQHLNVKEDTIKPLGDGEAAFHKAVDLTQHLPGLGERARRYAMYVDNGTIKILHVDEKGPTSYVHSGPDNMLKSIEQLKKEGVLDANGRSEE